MRRKRRPETPAKAYETAAARTATCANTLAPNPCNESGPINTTTPRNPTKTPSKRLPVSFSSLVNRCATTTVDIGVVAFRIAASPEAMWVWPQTTRQNGTALLRRLIPKNARQVDQSAGIRFPIALTSAFRMIAAKPTRRNTIVSGGNALPWTPAKKNDPPHNTDNSNSASHSLRSMRRLTSKLSVISFLSADVDLPPVPPGRRPARVGTVVRHAISARHPISVTQSDGPGDQRFNAQIHH